jgi:hypothetical protein
MSISYNEVVKNLYTKNVGLSMVCYEIGHVSWEFLKQICLSWNKDSPILNLVLIEDKKMM